MNKSHSASCLILVPSKRKVMPDSGRAKAKPNPPLFDLRDLLDLLYLEIYPLIQAGANRAFPELRFIRVKGGWRATKGTIDGTSAKGNVSYYDNRSYCLVNRKTNGIKKIWNYVQERDNLDDLGTLRRLFEMANCTLNEIKKSA